MFPTWNNLYTNYMDKVLGIVGREKKQVKDLSFKEKYKLAFKHLCSVNQLDPEAWVNIAYLK